MNIRYQGNALRDFLEFFIFLLLIVIPIFIKEKNPWGISTNETPACAAISIFQDTPLCIYSVCNTLSHEHYWNWAQLGLSLAWALYSGKNARG